MFLIEKWKNRRGTWAYNELLLVGTRTDSVTAIEQRGRLAPRSAAALAYHAETEDAETFAQLLKEWHAVGTPLLGCPVFTLC